MIYDIARHELLMDFADIPTPYGQPSDMDLFYVGNKYVIMGEIKHETGTFTQTQRRLYEDMGYHLTYTDVLILYITHDKRVEAGYKRVDISKCYVSEFWYKPAWSKDRQNEKPQWKKPSLPTTVEQIFLAFISKREQKPIEEWGKR